MYKLLYTLKKRKGIQAHVFDEKEDVIRMLYLNHNSITPKEDVPISLSNFLLTEQKSIQEGKYVFTHENQDEAM